jgi:RNA polymerase sigma-70 factor (ECF subfamily)
MVFANDVLTSPTLLGELAGSGNTERAWRVFLERYLPLIHDRCRRMGLQPANVEVVSADVLDRLVRKMKTFVYDPRRRFRGFLSQTVTYAVRNFWRDVKRHPADWASGSPEVYAILMGVAARESLNDLAETLGPAVEEGLERAHQIAEEIRQRVLPHNWQAYWRTAIEGRPGAAVAAELGMTVDAVFVAAHRVGKMLRKEGARWLASDSRPNEVMP